MEIERNYNFQKIEGCAEYRHSFRDRDFTIVCFSSLHIYIQIQTDYLPTIMILILNVGSFVSTFSVHVCVVYVYKRIVVRSFH